MEDIELLDIAGDELDMEKVRLGELTPVFFGSALTNFGVEPFLEHFLQMTTSPLARNSNIGEIDPFDDKFSAFVCLSAQSARHIPEAPQISRE